jgi:hypothetical protein
MSSWREIFANFQSEAARAQKQQSDSEVFSQFSHRPFQSMERQPGSSRLPESKAEHVSPTPANKLENPNPNSQLVWSGDSPVPENQRATRPVIVTISFAQVSEACWFWTIHRNDEPPHALPVASAYASNSDQARAKALECANRAGWSVGAEDPNRARHYVETWITREYVK